MLDFVLKDVSPEKIGDFKNFLKEMNDAVVLLTVAGGPYVSANDLQTNASGESELSRSEGGFNILFHGQTAAGRVTKGSFELSTKGTKLLLVSYTVRDDDASDMRVQINAEGESLAKKELEIAFKRDFSQEAHEYIKSPLEALRRKIERDKQSEASEESTVSEDDQETIDRQPAEIAPAKEEVTVEEVVEEENRPVDEVSQELFVTPRTLELLHDKRALMPILSNLCHDLTRGATVNFSTYELTEETLENGALIHMLDDVQEVYTITMRIGVLDNLTEVSFFLEKEGALVFSVYLSSEGKGNVAAPVGQGHIAHKKANEYLT